MQVITTHPKSLSGAGWLALLVFAILAVALSYPGMGEVQTRPHAIQRHGLDALKAREANFGGDPGQRYDCPDGRTRYIKHLSSGEWAVSILDGTIEVTSFVTSNYDYVARLIDGCNEDWRKVHP